MTLEEMFAKVKSGEATMISDLGTRDENIQSKKFNRPYSKLSMATGINSHAFVPKDVVIPFNPYTCEVDNNFNSDRPFRPEMAVSTVLGDIKKSCLEDQELRSKWEKRLGITFSDGDLLRDEYLAFKHAGYIKVRIMTYWVTSLSFDGANGMPEYARRYTIDRTKLNDSYGYDSNPPIYYQAACLFSAILKPEADNAEKALKNEGVTDESKLRDARSDVWKKNPVGFPKAANLVPFFEVPIGKEPKAIDTNAEGWMKEVESCVKFLTLSDKWSLSLSKVSKDDRFDPHMDYYDVTIETPTSADQKNDGTVYTDDDRNALYQAMSIKVTDGRDSIDNGTILNAAGKEVAAKDVLLPLLDVFSFYSQTLQEQSMEGTGQSFEQKMAASNGMRPVETVDDSILGACAEVFAKKFATSRYFTEDIRKSHSALLDAIDPNNAKALAKYDEDELVEAAAESKKNLKTLVLESTSSTLEEGETTLVDDVTDIVLAD